MQYQYMNTTYRHVVKILWEYYDQEGYPMHHHPEIIGKYTELIHPFTSAYPSRGGRKGGGLAPTQLS